MAKLKNYNGRYYESEYECAFLGFLEEIGWGYSLGDDIRRDYKRDVLIEDDFKDFVSKSNNYLTKDEVNFTIFLKKFFLKKG